MTNIIRPMFPHTFDSTMLSSFRACPQKFFRQYVEHWKPVMQSVHLVAGGAFASGIEAAREAFYVKGSSQEDSQAAGLHALITHYGDFQCPPESSKSLERMCGALEYYFDCYPLGKDGAEPIKFAGDKRGIEFSFAEPLPTVKHPVSGQPILWTGRSDMIAYRAGGVAGYDEKTTSSLGASWGRQWELRSQFTGYIWAAAQQGISINEWIIRGISILKTSYNTLEVSTYRTSYEVDLWLKQTERDIERAKILWEQGYWDYSLDGACIEYGGCPFTRVCKSSNPEAHLPVYFEQKVWDPLARRALSVKEHEEVWGHTRHPSETPAPELRLQGAAASEGLQESFNQLMGK